MMAKQDENEEEDEPEGSSAEPLRTREIFLDTESYRRQGFDASRPSLAALKNYVGENRLQLHMTDITWLEIERQLSEQAREAVDQIQKARDTAAKWQRRAPDALGGFRASEPLDAGAVAREAVSNFRYELPHSVNHSASDRGAKAIFDDYFARRAPFDSASGKSVKEFPDAFVIAELDAWCLENDTRMYVVTYDKAMRRAAEATSTLIPLLTLDHLLETVTIDHSPDILERGKAIIDELDQSEELGEAIDGVIGDCLLIQLDGFAFHSAAGDRRRDLEADARLALRGYTVLRFDFYQVFFRWEYVLDTIATAIAQGLHRRQIR